MLRLVLSRADTKTPEESLLRELLRITRSYLHNVHEETPQSYRCREACVVCSADARECLADLGQSSPGRLLVVARGPAGDPGHSLPGREGTPPG